VISLRNELKTKLNKTIIFDFEIKSDPRNSKLARKAELLARSIYQFIQDHSLTGEVMLRSFDPLVLATW